MRKIDQLNQLQGEMKEARITVEELCRDWGWTLFNNEGNAQLIDRIAELEDKLEEAQNTIDMKQEQLDYFDGKEAEYNEDVKGMEEEIDRLYKEIGRHIGRINQLAAENEELRAQIEELKDNKLYSIVKEKVEGDDAMDQPKAQPKKTNKKLAAIKKNNETKEEFSLKVTKEEPKEQTKDDMAITINWTQDVFDEKVNDFSCMMMGVHGEVTINDKNYKFKARRAYMPVIYGCFDEQLVEQAREEMKKINRFNITDERTNDDPNFKYAQDKEYPIVVWRAINNDGTAVYHGYTKCANNITALVWDKYDMDEKKSNYVGKTLVRNLFTNKKNIWRKLENETLADKFRAVCADIWPEDFTKEAPQGTNEIVVDCTNDATAGCDDLDI